MITPAQLGQLCKQAAGFNQNPYLPLGGMSQPPQQPAGMDLGSVFRMGTNPAPQPSAPKPSWLSNLGSTVTSPFRSHVPDPNAWKQTPRGVENNWWSAGRGALDAASVVTRSPWAIPAAIGGHFAIDAAQQKYAPRPEATRNDYWFYNPERFRHEQGYGPEHGAQNNWYSALGRTASRMASPLLAPKTTMSLASHPIRSVLNSVPMALSRPYEQAKAWWQGGKLPYSAAEIIDPLYTRK